MARMIPASSHAHTGPAYKVSQMGLVQQAKAAAAPSATSNA